jgi:3-deoxy-7-phosphoheptulonate synthase
VGAHGLMVEVHHRPEMALSDGAQSLLPEQFEDLNRQVQAIFSLFRTEGDRSGVLGRTA